MTCRERERERRVKRTFSGVTHRERSDRGVGLLWLPLLLRGGGGGGGGGEREAERRFLCRGGERDRDLDLEYDLLLQEK